MWWTRSRVLITSSVFHSHPGHLESLPTWKQEGNLNSLFFLHQLFKLTVPDPEQLLVEVTVTPALCHCMALLVVLPIKPDLPTFEAQHCQTLHSCLLQQVLWNSPTIISLPALWGCRVVNPKHTSCPSLCCALLPWLYLLWLSAGL